MGRNLRLERPPWHHTSLKGALLRRLLAFCLKSSCLDLCLAARYPCRNLEEYRIWAPRLCKFSLFSSALKPRKAPRNCGSRIAGSCAGETSSPPPIMTSGCNWRGRPPYHIRIRCPGNHSSWVPSRSRRLGTSLLLWPKVGFHRGLPAPSTARCLVRLLVAALACHTTEACVRTPRQQEHRVHLCPPLRSFLIWSAPWFFSPNLLCHSCNVQSRPYSSILWIFRCFSCWWPRAQISLIQIRMCSRSIFCQLSIHTQYHPNL